MLSRLKTVYDISDILQSRFGLTADVQVIPVAGEGRTLYLLEHIPVGNRTTVAGLERLSRRICKALGAELHGTVNIDFVSDGGPVSFDMMAEAEI